jgi:thiamine-phosphate pyrophosphorylase
LVNKLGFSLCLVTNRSQVAGSLEEAVETCLEAGLKAVQLREKDLEVRDLLSLAGRFRELTRRHGARLFVNDRADVALAVGADGVQRTATSLPVWALRSISPSGFMIGASVHSMADARIAEPEGADFLVFGPVYDTASKRQYGPPQGLAALERVASAVRLPVFAVGGITPERVPEVMRAGASGVAVIGAILGAERPAVVVSEFLDQLGGS